jgi:hypothetical protein
MMLCPRHNPYKIASVRLINWELFFFFNVSRTNYTHTKWFGLHPSLAQKRISRSPGKGEVEKLWHSSEFSASKLAPNLTPLLTSHSEFLFCPESPPFPLVTPKDV